MILRQDIKYQQSGAKTNNLRFSSSLEFPMHFNRKIDVLHFTLDTALLRFLSATQVESLREGRFAVGITYPCLPSPFSLNELSNITAL